MGKIVYRKARMSDARQLRDHINRLIREDAQVAFAPGKPFTLKEEKAWLKNSVTRVRKGDAVSIVAEVDGRVVGNVGISREGSRARPTHMMHYGLFGIAISDPDFRGKKIGERLARLALTEAKKIGISLVALDPFSCNAPAIALYKKLGFRECGRIPGGVLYKGKYVDRIMMFKRL
ncbi:MAG: GNAT family N-acetyltransferase [Candidatus ainarchaeum sp.]|nr:GNAT family N-acetyltransferase [Candidatus ainarchaeum sp.]